MYLEINGGNLKKRFAFWNRNEEVKIPKTSAPVRSEHCVFAQNNEDLIFTKFIAKGKRKKWQNKAHRAKVHPRLLL